MRSNVKFGPKDIEKALDFENEIQKDTCPIYKFNQRRLKVKGKAPKEEAASFVEDVEGETNKRESTTKELKKMVKKFKANENLGDDDVVEDFELWDE